MAMEQGASMNTEEGVTKRLRASLERLGQAAAKLAEDSDWEAVHKRQAKTLLSEQLSFEGQTFAELWQRFQIECAAIDYIQADLYDDWIGDLLFAVTERTLNEIVSRPILTNADALAAISALESEECEGAGITPPILKALRTYLNGSKLRLVGAA
jgi:hypothetical protein